MMDREQEIYSLNRQVTELYHEGRYAEAVRFAEEAARVARDAYGPRHPEVATQLNNLALVRQYMGDYSGAEPGFREAIEIWQEVLGPRDPQVATGLDNLAMLHKDRGDYRAAEPLCRQALEIFRESLGPWHPQVATALNNLAQLNQFLGDRATAASLYREALEMTRATLGPHHPEVAPTLSNLASLHHEAGELAAAEQLYREALEVWAAQHPRHPGVAAALQGIAKLHADTGDLGPAEHWYREALEMLRDAFGPRHPNVAASLESLAEVHLVWGEHAEAEALAREALEILRETLGPRHPKSAGAMRTLAWVLLAKGGHSEAEALLREALEVHRGADSLSSLAWIHLDAGDAAAAEPLFREALDIRRQALGPSHAAVARSLDDLASLLAATDRNAEALGFLLDAARIHDRLIAQLFSMGSERHRLALVQALRGDTSGFLSFVNGRFRDDPGIVAIALDLVLRRKGAAAEAVAAQRDAVFGGRYPELSPSMQELSKLRMQIARKILSGPGPDGPEEHQRLLSDWTGEKERLEGQLAATIPEIRDEDRLHEADRAAVASALPEGSTLIEFVRFDEFDFRARRARRESRWKPPRYVAFILMAGDPDGVRMVDLGEAGPIDALVARYRDAVTGEGRARGIGTIKKRAKATQEETAGVALRQAVFDPLLPHLGDRTRLFVAPDGDLTRFPLEVLPTDDGGRLIKGYVFSYLSAGRDVLRFGVPTGTEADVPLVAAAPNFDLGGASSAAAATSKGRRSRDIDSSRVHFDPLRGTVQEGEEVGNLLGAAPWMGDAVLEARLKAVRSPLILHLATHGFFLPDQEQHPDAGTQAPSIEATDVTGPLRGLGMENPLLRSGLALSGANTFIQGRPLPPEAEDGILTAEDVSGLDLLGTELVVLSACETGLGEVRLGEGVFGLRRAFVLAGAKTLVMSLWKVPDDPTRELMGGFYERLLAGESRVDALRGAQLDLAKKYPHPWFWGAFICQGNPGLLVGPRVVRIEG